MDVVEKIITREHQKLLTVLYKYLIDWHPFSLRRLWCHALNGGSGTVSGVAGEAKSASIYINYK